ncbi:MAG: formylglycine-generating enzyme family protein, partial [Anaerolineales bacterium]|nr:formylglycine-generating enzyme family protein [Anaerolineales bacterium]
MPVPIEELLVYVPAGRFVMGSDPEFDTLAEDDEFPQHSVLLDGFFIYRNEVTNGLYKQCVAAGDCTEPTIFEEGPSTYYNDPEYLNHPIVGVTWAQADAFCTWADSRLPTEAEWEKTARGEFGNIYPWGNNDPECSLANLDGCFMDPEFTDKIGQRPDGESLYEADDMAGNVWEWTQDWYDEDYYHTAPGMNPAGPENGELRVVRGGSYEDNLEALRSAERLALDPDEAYNNVGFRCVPIGLPSAAKAPFCQTTYTPFCFGDEPDCGPLAQATPQSDDYEFVSFGCPQDGLITMRIVANRPAGNGETVMVGAAVYTCIDSTVYPGQWICTGSPPPAGTLTTVQVCPGPTAAGGGALVAFGGQPVSPSGEQLVAYQPAAAAQPAGLQAFEPQSGPQGLAAFQTAAGPDYCADGYVYNPTTGQCEQ